MKTTIKFFVLTSVLVFSFGSNVFAQWATDPANTSNVYNTNTGKVGIGVIPQPDVLTGSYPNLSSTLQIRGASGRTAGTGQLFLPVVKITSPINNNSIGLGLENSYNFNTGLTAASFINTEGRLNIYSTDIAMQGNVGIGFIGTTIVPTQKLEVNGNIKMYGGDFLISAGGDRGVGGRALVHGWNNSLMINYNNDFNGGTIMMGKVQIGNRKPTTETNFALAVDGQIVSTEIKVTAPSTWADYVFDKNYKLKSLAETETYIKANNHLPDVPSAADIQSKGYDLSVMDATLLQKIEELYLHTIKLEKIVEEQQRTINALTK